MDLLKLEGQTLKVYECRTLTNATTVWQQPTTAGQSHRIPHRVFLSRQRSSMTSPTVLPGRRERVLLYQAQSPGLSRLKWSAAARLFFQSHLLRSVFKMMLLRLLAGCRPNISVASIFFLNSPLLDTMIMMRQYQS